MKVGTITFLTALLLALPLTAMAGGDPCAGSGGDTDGDTICDDVDNCVDTSNVGQSDVDSDGQGDICDNCLNVPNGPLAGPYPGRYGAFGPGVAGTTSAGLQCDTNNDGYGNACDADVDNNGFSLAVEFGAITAPALATGAFVWVANIPGGTLTHPDAQEVDMDCNNFKLAVEIGTYYNPMLALGAVVASPPRSGLSCVAAPFAPTPPGSCAPHN